MIIGIDKIHFEHGGRFDTGFWTGASIKVIKQTSEVSYSLTDDESEDLEYVILKWLKKRKKFGKVSL